MFGDRQDRDRHDERGWPLVEWENGSRHGRLAVVHGRGMLVGRCDDADLSLDDPAVSRRHALLVCEPDRTLKIVDLESANGTFVNERRVLVALLCDADVVGFGGSAALRIRYPVARWRDTLANLARSAKRWMLRARHRCS